MSRLIVAAAISAAVVGWLSITLITDASAGPNNGRPGIGRPGVGPNGAGTIATNRKKGGPGL